MLVGIVITGRGSERPLGFAFAVADAEGFGWAGMSSLREGRMDELRSRMAGIKEHDLKPAATLTQNMLTLHDKVHDRQGHEPKREVDQKWTLGPK